MIKSYQYAPVKVLGLLFCLHPFWWILGVDQLVFPIVCSILVIVGLYHNYLKISGISNLLLILCLIHLVAFVNLYFEPRHDFYSMLYIYKNFLSFSAILTFIILSNMIQNTKEVIYILNAFITLIFCSLVVTVIGYVYYKFKGESNIHTVLSYFASGYIGNYDLFAQYMTKSIIRGTKIFDFDVVRSAGLFQWPNLFSFALEQSSFICLVIAFITRKKRYLILCFFCIIFTFASTSRSGIVSLILGLVMIIPVYLLITRAVNLFISSTVLIVILVTIFYFNTYNSYKPEISQLLQARGHSLNSRETIYLATVNLIKQHPLIGWGTNRKISENLAYAGSHSTYLSITLKSGIIGLSIFILFLVVVLRRAFRIRDTLPWRLGSPWVKAALIACMIQQMIHMLFLDINDDIVVLNQTFSIWAVIIALEDISCNSSHDSFQAANQIHFRSGC